MVSVLTAEQRLNGAAAVLVADDQRGTVLVEDVSLTSCAQRRDDQVKVAALPGEPVLGATPLSRLLVRLATEDVVLDEVVQAPAQERPRYSEALLELVGRRALNSTRHPGMCGAGPKVLLADELSLGLAPLVVCRLLKAVKDATARGVGVIIVEQHARLALDYADRAYVMDRGRIVREGSAVAILADIAQIEATYLGGPTTAADPTGP